MGPRKCWTLLLPSPRSARRGRGGGIAQFTVYFTLPSHEVYQTKVTLTVRRDQDILSSEKIAINVSAVYIVYGPIFFITGRRLPGRGALPYKPVRDVPFFRVSFFSINS